MQLKAKLLTWLGSALVVIALALSLLGLLSLRAVFVGEREHARASAALIAFVLSQDPRANAAAQAQLLERAASAAGLLSARLLPWEVVEPQYVQALREGEAHYELGWQDGVVLHALWPYRDAAGQTTGVIQVDSDLGALQGSASLALGAILCCLLALLIGGVIFLKRILQPSVTTLLAMRAGFTRLAKGDFHVRLPGRGAAELLEVSQAFNTFAEQMGGQLQTLHNRLYGCFPGDSQLPADTDLLRGTADLAAGVARLEQFRQRCGETPDSAQLFVCLLEHLRADFALGHVAIYVFEPGSRSLSPVVVTGQGYAESSWCRSDALRFAETGCHACLRRLVIDGLDVATRCPGFDPAVSAQGLIHWCMPIQAGQRRFGVLQLVLDPVEYAQLQAQQALLHSYVATVLPLLEARVLAEGLRAATLRDEITGLANLAFLHENMPGMLARALRRNACLGVVEVDLMSHDAEGISRCGRLLQQSVRAADLVAHLGGARFTVVLPDTEPDGVLLVAEKLRAALRAQEDLWVAVGMAIFPMHGRDLDALLAFAHEQAQATCVAET